MSLIRKHICYLLNFLDFRKKGNPENFLLYKTSATVIFNSKIISFYMIFVVCILFSVLILIGCATTQDVGKVQWEINELKSGLKDLREKSPTQNQIEKSDKTLQQLQNTQESTSRTVSDLTIQFQSLESEFRALTGRFEESRYYAEKNLTEMKEEKEKLTARLKDLELSIDDLKKKIAPAEITPSDSTKNETKEADEKMSTTGSKENEEGKSAAGTEKVQGTDGKTEGDKDAQSTDDKNKASKQDVKDIYLAGYQAFKAGKTADAREKLASVIKDYPDSEYSDNARFWIAESYYKEGNYEDAILAYEELMKKNPKSDKVSGAMLKQGLSFYAIKDEKTGRIILERLIEKFPNSEQAQTARKKIGKPAPSKKK